MDSKKSNKIREIVRLQQILKKWKKLANAPKNNNMDTTNTTSNGSGSRKGIKFLKKTLSFSDRTSSNNMGGGGGAPKGFLALCVGEEEQRFTVPTEYLGHHAFQILLREAEDEYGFQQEGVLKLPCQVYVFEKILKLVQGANTKEFQIGPCYSPESDHHLTNSPHYVQMCR